MALIVRALRDSLAWLSRGWHDAVYLQERLIQSQRPWEYEALLVRTPITQIPPAGDAPKPQTEMNYD